MKIIVRLRIQTFATIFLLRQTQGFQPNVQLYNLTQNARPIEAEIKSLTVGHYVTCASVCNTDPCCGMFTMNQEQNSETCRLFKRETPLIAAEGYISYIKGKATRVK